MSEVQGIAGPRLDLDGPPPVAPKHALLSTPGVVVEEDSLGRWLNGVNWIGWPADPPLGWNACDPNLTGSAIKAEGDPFPQETFDPFVCYLPVTCSTISYSFIRERSLVALDAAYSYVVEQALVGAISVGAINVNPSLGDSNVTILGGAAKSPIVALSYLENAIGATGKKGIIHATPAIIAQLNTDTFLDPDQLITTNGNYVVSGGGYIGAEANGNAPGAGQDYMFASGLVEVRLSPVSITDLAESLDRSDNTVTFRAERWVLATWDTSLQAAVLVDWDA